MWRKRIILIPFIWLVSNLYAQEMDGLNDIVQVVIDVEQDLSSIPSVAGAIANDTDILWQGTSNCEPSFELSGFACPADTVSIDDQFRIGSETKTFTGTLLLRLIDEGHLEITDTLEELAPELGIPGASEITLLNLLQMTSGVPDYLQAPATDGSDGTINDQYVREFAKLPFPDPAVYIEATNSMDRFSGMHYSNTNFAILAMIAEKTSCSIFASCQTFEQLLQHYVFQPMGFSLTHIPETDGFTSDYATGYVMLESGQPVTGTASLASPNADILSDSFALIDPDLPWAAGAVISQVDEQVDWIRQLAKNDKGLLSPAIQRLRLTLTVPGEVAGDPADYGLAIYKIDSPFNGSTFVGHAGAIYGYTSALFYNEVADLFYVFNVNQFPAYQTADSFLWAADKAVQYLQMPQGSCSQAQTVTEPGCSGVNVRTNSLMIGFGQNVSIAVTGISQTGYEQGNCNTDETTGATTCAAIQTMVPSLAAYGHDLDAILLEAAMLVIEQGAHLEVTGRNSQLIVASGDSTIDIAGVLSSHGSNLPLIEGSDGNDTLIINDGAVIDGDIDLAGGVNTYDFRAAILPKGNIEFSGSETVLLYDDASLTLSLAESGTTLSVTDATGTSVEVTSSASLTEVELDGQSISSNALLLPLDVDEDSSYDLVVYADNTSGEVRLALSSAIFSSGFELPLPVPVQEPIVKKVGSAGGIGGIVLLTLTLLIELRRRKAI